MSRRAQEPTLAIGGTGKVGRRVISRAVGRQIRYVPISSRDFAAGAAEQGVPSEVVEMLTFIFGEVLDGRGDYVRDTAATGIWEST